VTRMSSKVAGAFASLVLIAGGATSVAAEEWVWDGSREGCEAVGGTFEREKGPKHEQLRTCTGVIEGDSEPAPGNDNWTVTEVIEIDGTWDHTEVGKLEVEATMTPGTKCFTNGGEDKTGHKHCTEADEDDKDKKK
jgi:hypothetical protein